MVHRDFDARFRGTALGRVWAAIAPFLMLIVYTIVFGLLIQPKWQDDISDKLIIPLIYYSGLVVFQFFMDVMSRAPTIIHENHVYVKKVVFPVEIFAWTIVGSGFIRFVINFVSLLVFVIVLRKLSFTGVLFMPLFIVPLAILSAGLVWFLAGLGAYVRDVAHVVMVISPVMMFVSPVFYPLSAIPEPARTILCVFNPLSVPTEALREALFEGAFHNWPGLAAYWLVALAVAVLGYRFFMRVRPGFADVL